MVKTVLEENEDELVLVAGVLSIPHSLADDYYGISIEAAKLKKIVEVYQWKEIQQPKTKEAGNTNGDNTTHVGKSYIYKRDWFDHHIDSNFFQRTYEHQNPPKEIWPAESKTEINDEVRIGSFVLGQGFKERMTTFKPLTSNELPISALKQVKLHNSIYYHSKNIWEPEIGEHRVRFFYAGGDGEPSLLWGSNLATTYFLTIP